MCSQGSFRFCAGEKQLKIRRKSCSVLFFSLERLPQEMCFIWKYLWQIKLSKYFILISHLPCISPSQSLFSSIILPCLCFYPVPILPLKQKWAGRGRRMKNDKVSTTPQISNFSFFNFTHSRKMVTNPRFVHLQITSMYKIPISVLLFLSTSTIWVARSSIAFSCTYNTKGKSSAAFPTGSPASVDMSNAHHGAWAAAWFIWTTPSNSHSSSSSLTIQ